jgi:hypothetical protein
MDFRLFEKAVLAQFEKMRKHTLYNAEVTKEQLWDTYLGSFPEGSNPMFRERTVHDCQCCKQFIRIMGNVITFNEGKVSTIWETAAEDENPTIAAVGKAMDELVREASIREVFYHYEEKVGTPVNHGVDPDGNAERWEHFHVTLPPSAVMPKDTIPTLKSKIASAKQVLTRALNEITMDSIDTVLDLINSNAIYRGEEFRKLIQDTKAMKLAFNLLEGEIEQEQWLWLMAQTAPRGVVHLRNAAIGTLLIDLSEGKPLEAAVKAFEAMVAPTNYKRPTALITPNMIKKAQETCEELGYTDALYRRHACLEDIRVNNVLYVSREAMKRLSSGNPFEQLKKETTVKMDSVENAEEISFDDFLKDILPKTEKLEILVENRHEGNLMSLLAPEHPDAPNMLKWGNNFSWSYNGEITDSMKQRVKAAGGKVDGVLRFSIQWNANETHNNCDYDAWCFQPDGTKIYFGDKTDYNTKGRLDVDIQSTQPGRPAVENITWPNERDMLEGTYTFKVHNYAARTGDDGFTAELEYNGEIRQYEYNKPLRQDGLISVVAGDFIRGKGFKVSQELPSTMASRDVWGLKTMRFHEVSVLMQSPNHWDGEETGNKHAFFMLPDCAQPGEVRGFYNEFLNDNLREHRKVFEMLGSKMRVPESDNQLSGLGFSSTQRNHVYAKVSGDYTRTLKIMF